MFCYKCGNKISEDMIFCNKCGTKITPDNAVSQTSNIANDENNFKNFVDNHIKTTTKFQSAKELLEKRVPLKFVWICFGIPIILGTLTFNLGILLLGIIVAYLAARIACGIIKGRYAFKISGKFNGNIDTDELILFLNKYLEFLHPYFHKWGYLKQEFIGAGLQGAITATAMNLMSESATEINLCTEFGEKKKLFSVINIRPDVLNPNSGQMEYFFSSEYRIPGFFKGWGFSTYTCLFKTAPILQAAMEYYLKNKRK